MSSYEERQRALIDEALAIPDPARRAQAISDILGTVKDANAELKEARRCDVLTLRGQSLTLREIGELLGMSTGRIDQIAKGK